MPAIPMNEFEKGLELIDTNYPFSIPTGLQLSDQIVVGLFSWLYLLLGSGYIASISHELVVCGI